MKVAIWGTKKEAVYCATALRKAGNRISCFIDNNVESEGEIDGIPVYTYEQMRARIERPDQIIIAIRNGTYIEEMIRQCHNDGIRNIGIMKLSASDFREPVYEDSILYYGRADKAFVPYLQVVLNKNCNLNCKGCTHFANIFNGMASGDNGDNSYEIAEYVKDIRRLSEQAEILRFRMLGGEPFLYKDLDEAIKSTREAMPDTDVRIVTNGVVIPSIDQDILRVIKERSVGIDISVYPETFKLKDLIRRRLEDAGVKYYFIGPVDDYIRSFSKNLSLKKESDPQRAMRTCHSHQCRTLYKGAIYKCPYDLFLKDYFSYFNITETYIGGLKISNHTASEIFQRLQDTVDACKYCSEKISTFDHEQKRVPDMRDWVIDED